MKLSKSGRAYENMADIICEAMTVRDNDGRILYVPLSGVPEKITDKILAIRLRQELPQREGRS